MDSFGDRPDLIHPLVGAVSLPCFAWLLLEASVRTYVLSQASLQLLLYLVCVSLPRLKRFYLLPWALGMVTIGLHSLFAPGGTGLFTRRLFIASFYILLGLRYVFRFISLDRTRHLFHVTTPTTPGMAPYSTCGQEHEQRKTKGERADLLVNSFLLVFANSSFLAVPALVCLHNELPLQAIEWLAVLLFLLGSFAPSLSRDVIDQLHLSLLSLFCYPFSSLGKSQKEEIEKDRSLASSSSSSVPYSASARTGLRLIFFSLLLFSLPSFLHVSQNHYHPIASLGLAVNLLAALVWTQLPTEGILDTLAN